MTCTRRTPPRIALFDGGRFRQHAVLQAALFAQTLQPQDVGVGNHRAGLIDALENSRRAGAQHQLFRRQRAADGCRHGVGIDIEQCAVGVRRQRD